MILAGVVNVLVLGSLFAEVSGECGGQITSSSGTIQSPDYPKQYPNGQECVWTVSVQGSVEGSVQNIRTSFSAFDLHDPVDGKCVDYVAIYRLQLGKDIDAVLEGKFCGNSLPRSIKIEESSMTVVFISDSDSVSNPHTGFSLNFEASFEDNSSVSQATAGIVAAVFCAVVFIGVGLLRCMMMGACNTCGGPNPGNDHDRQVVGTNDSYTYQADFPPSYSTVMDHPERFPTPEASPMITAQNRNGTVVTNGQVARAEFTLQASDSSDEDDNDSPPPPYPGLVTSQSDDDVNDTRNRTDLNQTNTNNVGEDINEEPPNEPVTSLEAPSVEVVDEQSSSTANTHEVPSYLSPATGSVLQERDNSSQRNGVELSQTDGPPEEPEMVIMI